MQQQMMSAITELQESDANREVLDDALLKDLNKIRSNTGKRERNITV